MANQMPTLDETRFLNYYGQTGYDRSFDGYLQILSGVSVPVSKYSKY
jgi:hypothetical protein